MPTRNIFQSQDQSSSLGMGHTGESELHRLPSLHLHLQEKPKQQMMYERFALSATRKKGKKKTMKEKEREEGKEGRKKGGTQLECF